MWISEIQAEAGLPAFEPNETTFVTEQNAYAIWQVAGDECELLSIAVKASERGKGIAKELMLRSHKELFALGVKTFFLEVRASNAAAISLYKKIGYRKIAERKNYYSNKEDAFIFSLDFT